MTVGSLSVGNIGTVREVVDVPQINNQINNSLTVEDYVRKYYSDIPPLVEVAKCESNFRQFNKDGKVLRGEANDADRGVMQINEMYHGERAEKLGFDIMTLPGNVAYARYLFEKEGLRPWSSSAPCWKRSEAYANYNKALAMK